MAQKPKGADNPGHQVDIMEVLEELESGALTTGTPPEGAQTKLVGAPPPEVDQSTTAPTEAPPPQQPTGKPRRPTSTRARPQPSATPPQPSATPPQPSATPPQPARTPAKSTRAKPKRTAVLLRIPNDINQQLKKTLKTEPVKLSRHTWILKAIREKASRDLPPKR